MLRAVVALAAVAAAQAASAPKKVIFIQDACLDDFLSIAVLARAHKAGEINWIGDIVVNADSTLPYSMELAYKFHHALEIEDIPVLLSQARIFNAFPWLYRGDTRATYELEPMKKIQTGRPEAKRLSDYKAPYAESWLEQTLEDAADGEITLLNVATMTIFEAMFKAKPHLAKKVKEMVWMAGAINVPGNTHYGLGHGYAGMNHYAEWNVVGDAEAANWTLENTAFPIYLVPLDICDKAPVNNSDGHGMFMDTLLGYNPADCMYPEITEALQIAYKTIAAPAPFYRLWDSSAAAYVVRHDFFLDEGTTKLACITDFSMEGWLAQPKDQTKTGPQKYRDIHAFYNYTNTSALQEWIASAACIPKPVPPTAGHYLRRRVP